MNPPSTKMERIARLPLSVLESGPGVRDAVIRGTQAVKSMCKLWRMLQLAGRSFARNTTGGMESAVTIMGNRRASVATADESAVYENGEFRAAPPLRFGEGAGG